MNMKVLLGKKIEMSQVFTDDGRVVPVTLIQAGPCTVTMVRKNPAGQQTAVLGFGEKNKPNKAQKGEWKDLGNFALTREFPVSEEAGIERGQKIDVTAFEPGDKVSISGTAKGKGFQGVVKRHNFSGSPASHGHKDQLRMPGSIGALGPQKVFKGTKMGGRMGGQNVTVKNLEIVQVDTDRNIVAVKGAVPGCRGGFVTITSSDGNVWHK